VSSSPGQALDITSTQAGAGPPELVPGLLLPNRNGPPDVAGGVHSRVPNNLRRRGIIASSMTPPASHVPVIILRIDFLGQAPEGSGCTGYRPEGHGAHLSHRPNRSLTPCRLTARRYSSVERCGREPPWFARTVYPFHKSVSRPPALPDFFLDALHARACACDPSGASTNRLRYGGVSNFLNPYEKCSISCLRCSDGS
jgi:hypothetical protein